MKRRSVTEIGGPSVMATRLGRVAASAFVLSLAGLLIFAFMDRSAASAAAGPAASGPQQAAGLPDTCYSTAYVSGFPGMYGFPGVYSPFFPTVVVAPAVNAVICVPDCAYSGSLISPYFYPYLSTVYCPGPPAVVTALPEPDAVECGSQSAITIKVTDANGFNVARGTLVVFSTSLGYITPSVATDGGQAVASLVINPKTTGVAVVTAMSGNAFTQKSVIVYGC